MLHKKSWHSIGFLFWVLIALLAFVVLVVFRYQQNKVVPSTKNSVSSTEQVKAESLAVTDKTELPQTEMIAVEPSKEIMSAEQALPSAGEPAYQSACQRLRAMYVSENMTKQAEEQKRYQDALQTIINTYSAVGMSFSSQQKTTQSLESKRHDFVMQQLETQLQRQLASIRC